MSYKRQTTPRSKEPISGKPVVGWCSARPELETATFR